MTKEMFLQELRLKLKGLPKDDIEDRVSFYSEMIDDRVEEGLSEEEAIKEIGTSDEIASKVIEATPLATIVKEKVKPKRKLTPFEIVLLILGFPLWFPFLIMFLVFVLIFTILLWSAVIVVWSIEGSLIAASFRALAGSLMLVIEGYLASAVGMFGLGLLGIGAAIFLFYLCVYATKLTFKLTKKIILGIKKSLVGGESR